MFYLQWLKRVFRKPTWVDAMSATAGVMIGAIGHYWPDSIIGANAWAIPILGFAALGLLRVFEAPYELWKEQIDSTAAFQEKLTAKGLEKNIRFDNAIEQLMHLATARELWWSECHRRTGSSVVYPKLVELITEIRKCFPPASVEERKEDELSVLHDAVANYGSELGFSRGKNERLTDRRNILEQEIANTKQRFADIEQPK